jgi:hypothetical protein
MSFVVVVEAPDLTWERAAEIASACHAPNGLEVVAPKQPRLFRRRRPTIWIESQHGADHLLADDAEWDAPTWSMTPSLLPRLVVTIRCLSEQLSAGFTFFAGWIGDDEKTTAVTTEELLHLAASGEIATRTRYVVRRASEAG